MLGHAPLSANALSAFGSLQSTSIVGAGGLRASGAAVATRSATLAASGGLAASGAAGVKRGTSRIATGGLTASGAASVLRGVVRTGSGGLRLGGTGVVLYFDPDLQLTLRAERRRLVLAAESRTAAPRFEKRRLPLQEHIP
jgi:hypothetical protein